MLGYCFLLLSYLAGRSLWAFGLGRSGRLAIERAPVPEWVIREPVSWISGYLLLSWLAYIGAYVFRSHEWPLLPGNTIAFAAGLLLVLAGYRRMVRSQALPDGNRVQVAPLIVLGASLALFGWLCVYTFFIRGSYIATGNTVAGDFGPHIAMIRSFSMGHNFPTRYPLFPDESLRYHFLFQFASGNLEYLGMRIDWAFNLPSTLAFSSALLLFYALAATLTGSAVAGALAPLFLFFRSGWAFWRFMATSSSLPDFWHRLNHNEVFIGITRNEDWGLWNQNVYLNQRHYAFGLAVLFYGVLSALPYLGQVQKSADESAEPRNWRQRTLGWLQHFLFSRAAWWDSGSRDRYLSLLPVAVLAGASGFWNGATFIATLLILFFLTLFARSRLEFLLFALVAGCLALVQNRFFVGAGGSAVKPEIWLGFLSDPPARLSTMLLYLNEVFGALHWMVGLALVVYWIRERRTGFGDCLLLRRAPGFLLAAFGIIAFAFTIKLTPDPAINHKYVMVAVMMLSLFAAWLVAWMWRQGWLTRVVSVVALFLMTATGWVDLISVIYKNRKEALMYADQSEPVHKWILANTKRTDVLLTDFYYFHTIIFTGRTVFYGWPYYSWSAGYNTGARDKIVITIYGGTDYDETLRLLHENRISYIVIDGGNRVCPIYKLQEKFLREKFQVVYDLDNTVILKVPAAVSSR